MSATRPTRAEREATRQGRRVALLLTLLVAAFATHQQLTAGAVQREVLGVLVVLIAFWMGQLGDLMAKWPR